MLIIRRDRFKQDCEIECTWPPSLHLVLVWQLMKNCVQIWYLKQIKNRLWKVNFEGTIVVGFFLLRCVVTLSLTPRDWNPFGQRHKARTHSKHSHSQVTRSSVTGKSIVSGCEGGVREKSFQVYFFFLGGERGADTTQLVFAGVNLRRNPANKPEKQLQHKTWPL